MTTPPGFSTADPKLISSWPRMLLQVAWNVGGNSSSPNHWYTITPRLRGSWKATLAGRQYELDAVQSGSMTFTLDNVDGAFDPDNSSSFFYPYVLPYRRCRLVFLTGPSQNLMFPWMASGTATTSQAASTGTLGTQTLQNPSPAGLHTCVTWALATSVAAGAVCGVTGATQSWSTTDSNGFTVTPGATYSLGVDGSIASGMSSFGLQAQLSWYTLTGSLISTVTSSTGTVTPTTWARMTVSGTAPSNAAFAIPSVVTTTATTTATTVQITGWQLEEATAPTTWVSPGTWAPIWQGFVERWPQKYDKDGKYGLVDVTAVDALAPLSQVTLGYAAPQYLALKSPQYRFALDTTTTSPDVVNGTAFADVGGTSTYLDIVGGNISTGNTITSTTSLGTLWNTPGPVITLSNNQASSLGNASGASYLRPATASGASIMLPTSGGWSRMICFRTTNTPGANSTYSGATLWATTAPGFTTGSGDQSGAQLYIGSNGCPTLKITNASNSASVFFTTGNNVCDGNWHCVIVTLSADGLHGQIITDGSTSGLSASADVHSTTYTQDAIGTLLLGTSTNTQPFNGDLAWFAQWNSTLDYNVGNDITMGFATGWRGDAINTRINRLLQLAGLNAGAAASFTWYGTSANLGSASLQGRSALDAIQETADTEVGQFAIDHAGIPTLYGHVWRWMQSQPLATFGENAAGGEIPYLEDIVFEQDPAHLFNDVQITCDNSQDLTADNQIQEASDSTSQAAYFPQTLSRTINPQYVQAGLNVANYLLSQFKDPHTRLDGLTVDLASNPALLSKVTGLRFADLVQVNRRPTLAPPKSLQCFIEQIEWSGDDTGGNLRLHLQMSPISQYRYGIFSAAWAQLTAGIAAGVQTVTVGAIQNNANIAAQYVIPSGCGYQMTLGYGTANAETVTIQSVQAVSAGYSSVQITFTAATTYSHASGDYLCDVKNTAQVPPLLTYPTCYDAVSLTGGTTPLIGY